MPQKAASDYDTGGDGGEHKLHSGRWDWHSYVLKGRRQEVFRQHCPLTAVGCGFRNNGVGPSFLSRRRRRSLDTHGVWSPMAGATSVPREATYRKTFVFTAILLVLEKKNCFYRKKNVFTPTHSPTSLGAAAPPPLASFPLAVALVASEVAIGWCGGAHGERGRS